MATRKIRYVGPHDDVSVRLPDGRQVIVARNHQAELPDEVAKSLNRQGTWEYVKEDKSKDKQDEPAGA